MTKCARCGETNPAEIHTCTPIALRLADEFDGGAPIAHTSQWKEEAADELRRLHALNEGMADVLREALVVYEAKQWNTSRIRAALAKAKEQT